MGVKISQTTYHHYRALPVDEDDQHNAHLSNKFKNLFTGKDQDNDQRKFRLSEDELALLVKFNKEYYRDNVLISYRHSALSYRLLNGPMSGLIIEAKHFGESIKLTLYPGLPNQQQTLSLIVKKLQDKLTNRVTPVYLEISDAAV